MQDLTFLLPLLNYPFKGSVNPATISKTEFCIFFIILNMDMYPIITNINKSA